MELLSPAGEYEALKGAINAGCDAVYLGGDRFGARAYAQNFTDEEIIGAIGYAHLFGVKIYLTVNTLIKEAEWQDVIAYIKRFYEAGLDGCIVQDLGLISAFDELFPGLECHVSTQGYITGRFSARFYKSFGATRVVLARELSLDEITDVKEKEDIEVEAFIHGAMCYAYSGNCLFSSCLGGRSGNRGRCAGPCRLDYQVISGGRESGRAYYLSMKDQCALNLVPELMDRGIDSLKIEGRMKKPEYSAFVTRTYRKYIDSYVEVQGAYKVSPKDREDLKHMYLRSEIGEGYFHTNNGKHMICEDSPAYNGNDELLMERTRSEYINKERKLPVQAKVTVEVSSLPEITFSTGGISVTAIGETPVEGARNRVTSEEDIKKQINRLGDTPFMLESMEVRVEGDPFIPVSVLNELRRKASGELYEALDRAYIDRRAVKQVKRPSFFHTKIPFDHKPIVSVTLWDQFLAASEAGDHYYIALSYGLMNERAAEIRDLASEHELLLDLPLVMRDRDADIIERMAGSAENLDFKGIICHNTEELGFLLAGDVKLPLIAGPELYAWNKRAAATINGFCEAMIAPYELSGYELKDLPKDMYISVYGRMPLMNSANCIEKTAFSCKKKDGSTFIGLKDRKGIVFPVRRNCDLCFNTIYNSVPTSLLEEVNTGKVDRGCMLLSFTDEDAACVKSVISAFFYGESLPAGEYTRAYRRRGVE